MSKQSIVVFLVGAVFGLALGFVLTNNYNRREADELREELARARSGAAQNPAPGPAPRAARDEVSIPDLTEDQLQRAVARADEQPDNLELQRDSGKNLYLYAMEKGNVALLPDVARILRRAHDADPKHYETTVLAANAAFLVARSTGDAALLADARKLYEAALGTRPEDHVVRTSLGLTYFLDHPPDARRAVREYRKVLAADPRHELALQSLVAALAASGELEEAERRLAELEGVNASNRELPNLRAQLEQKRNAAGGER